jgi:hypothetical protein
MDGPDAETEPEPPAEPTQRPRPQPRPVLATSPRGTPGVEENEIPEPDVVVTDAEHDPPTPTPVATPRPKKAVYKVKSPTKLSVSAGSPGQQAAEASEPEIDWRSPLAETPSRKRLRSADGEEEELPAATAGDVVGTNVEDAARAHTVSREPTPSNEIQMRRKRVRH